MTEDAADPPKPLPPFQTPAWGKALGILVLVIMLVTVIFSAWVMATYWGSISV